MLAGSALVPGSWALAAQPAREAPPASSATPAAASDPSPQQAAGGAIESIDERLEVLANRPIRAVKLAGILPEDEPLARNQIRVAAGQALASEAVRSDVRRLSRLGRFERIEAAIQLFDDGSVEVTYNFVPAPIIRDVVAVGNREVSDQELAGVVGLIANTPANPFVLDQAKRRIVDLYASRGYYQANVEIDEKELREQGVVAFRIREGDRLRVTDIRFEGNGSIEAKRLRQQVETKTWGIFERGVLDDQAVQRDVAKLEQYYKDQGHLRAIVGRRITPSPDGKEAILTFVVDEGPVFYVRSIEAVLDDASSDGGDAKPTVLTPEQIAGLSQLKAGDVFSATKVKNTVQAVTDALQQMGYIDARVRSVDRQSTDSNQADLLLVVSEGKRWNTGLVNVKGNQYTQARVIRRQVRVLPDRPLDGVALKETRDKLDQTRLFAPGSVRVTPQRPDEKTPDTRDVLIEVEETNTGSIGFGASVDSDGGVLGQISLNQRNFDIFDTPDSWDEFISGRAFRGAGQSFNLTLQPGNDIQNYVIGISDPALFESDYSGGLNAGFRTREFRQYDEQRISFSGSVGRRFGDRWSGGLNFRIEDIDISKIDTDAAQDLFRDEGNNILTGVGFRLRRSALDKPLRPTRGTVTDIGIERVGLLGGDYGFTKASGNFAMYVPIDEDIAGNRTVLLLRTGIDYIPEDQDDVPVSERYFLGGRDFRGFRFRGVGPRGPRNDNPDRLARDSIGGTWSFFAGAQVEQPLIDNNLSIVGFVDSGTVTFDPGFDEYRVAVGVGMRIYIPALGPVPLALDFGFPVIDQSGDQRRLFSFSFDLPFQ